MQPPSLRRPRPLAGGRRLTRGTLADFRGVIHCWRPRRRRAPRQTGNETRFGRVDAIAKHMVLPSLHSPIHSAVFSSRVTRRDFFEHRFPRSRRSRIRDPDLTSACPFALFLPQPEFFHPHTISRAKEYVEILPLIIGKRQAGFWVHVGSAGVQLRHSQCDI